MRVDSESRSFSSISFGALLLFSLVLLSSSASAQKAKKPGAKKPEAKAPAKPVSRSEWLIKGSFGTINLGEFEAAYKRMNDKQPYVTTLDSLKDFLAVYTDYRLKLLDAKQEGLDKDPKIGNEIAGYRRLLAGPYLLERELTDPWVDRLYARRQDEVRADHFLAAVKNWNNPADTLEAYKRALEAIQLLDEGYPMSFIVLNSERQKLLVNGDQSALHPKHVGMKLDWKGSDDQSSVTSGGDLGWFTAGMTLRPFEEAIYSLSPGDYTHLPVRTKFGYHVMKVTGRRPRIGGVKVSQILVGMPKEQTDTTEQYHRIDSLYRAIQNGASFEQVARESSDDKYTAANGGDMGFIDHESRRADPAFDEAAYGLKDGQISGVIRTSFGYHIVKRTGTIPPRSIDEERSAIKKLYKQYFFDQDKEEWIAAHKKQDNIRVDSSVIDYVIKNIDSTKTSIETGWAKNLTDRSRTVFTLDGKVWDLGALIDTMTSEQGTALSRASIKLQIEKQIEDHILMHAAENIDTRYPEFEKIMADYRNGITLFELENQRVWSHVKPDSLKELAYYDAHRAKFMWPERIDISEIYVTSDSLSRQLFERLRNGENFDTLAAHYTERPGFKAKAGHWGLVQKDDNDLAKRSFDFIVDEVKEPMAFQGGYSIVKLNRRDPIHGKTFDEARQEVASQYQDELAKDLRLKWVVDLRKKYNVKVNTDLITRAWKETNRL